MDGATNDHGIVSMRLRRTNNQHQQMVGVVYRQRIAIGNPRELNMNKTERECPMYDNEPDGTGGALYEHCNTCEQARDCYGPDEEKEEFEAATVLADILGGDAKVVRVPASARTMIIIRDKDTMERVDNVQQMTITPDTVEFQTDDIAASIGTDRIAEIIVSIYMRS